MAMMSMTGYQPNGKSRITIGSPDLTVATLVAERLAMTSAHRVALLRELTLQVAYQFWTERGRPSGSPEVDWFHAQALLDRLRSIWMLEGF
jgi:hypothetical protein